MSKVAAATQAASSEARLTSRAEAAETRASTSNILKITESLDSAMCEADQGRCKVHELVTALTDKTKGCTAIRAELEHMRLELSPWTKVGGSTPVRSGAATGSKMIQTRV